MNDFIVPDDAPLEVYGGSSGSYASDDLGCAYHDVWTDLGLDLDPEACKSSKESKAK